MSHEANIEDQTINRSQSMPGQHAILMASHVLGELSRHSEAECTDASLDCEQQDGVSRHNLLSLPLRSSFNTASENKSLRRASKHKYLRRRRDELTLQFRCGYCPGIYDSLTTLAVHIRRKHADIIRSVFGNDAPARAARILARRSNGMSDSGRARKGTKRRRFRAHSLGDTPASTNYSSSIDSVVSAGMDSHKEAEIRSDMSLSALASQAACAVGSHDILLPNGPGSTLDSHINNTQNGSMKIGQKGPEDKDGEHQVKCSLNCKPHFKSTATASLTEPVSAYIAPPMTYHFPGAESAQFGSLHAGNTWAPHMLPLHAGRGIMTAHCPPSIQHASQLPPNGLGWHMYNSAVANSSGSDGQSSLRLNSAALFPSVLPHVPPHMNQHPHCITIPNNYPMGPMAPMGPQYPQYPTTHMSMPWHVSSVPGSTIQQPFIPPSCSTGSSGNMICQSSVQLSTITGSTYQTAKKALDDNLVGKDSSSNQIIHATTELRN